MDRQFILYLFYGLWVETAYKINKLRKEETNTEF
jgi:hypothetical protein